MRLIFLGAPASGKGTQAGVLTVALGVPKISTGDMLRAARAAGTPLGKAADEYMAKGALVPDSVVIGLVEERIAQPDAAKGFILDGFPRTVAQADALGEMLVKKGAPIDAVIQIDVPESILLERATGRRTDVRTGQIYHIKYNPPPSGAELEHRADDREAVVASRLQAYNQQTAALIPYYEGKGLLKRIDGDADPSEVTARIRAAVTQN
ncbi:MAG TPA: adenylate kinase [Polyangiaceae bacterium]|jgi:adenylate kinase|nr:adenylate kinase [Polyangiaceae bacterium]